MVSPLTLQHLFASVTIQDALSVAQHPAMDDTKLAVSRSWRNVVTSSPTIKQALFLAPTKSTLVWTLTDKAAASPTGPGGSGLLGPSARFSELDRLVTIDEVKETGREYLVQARVNGVLPYRHLHFSQRLDSAHSVWSFCNYIHPDGVPVETAFLTNIKAVRKMHVSYRRMFISQPPCQVVEIGVYGGRSQALIEKIVQVTQQIVCLEVALWMKDVSFVRRKPEVMARLAMTGLGE
ncbi:hypothetical protein B0A55_03231 [Friedmanniomyces simplex]|uniref:Uncharacterized protein n=1 Tax=Friedmanniomyces simplex TaxID=329884 RepID=A0A4V5NH45_9PEZI|nr:hypothetical protein B0A55_03231 [Friedmanniomyces simplex]